jgi:transmembrane 9 superfamily protein 1
MLGFALLALASGQAAYTKGEAVKSHLTKVYPFNNPHETYRYYDTPLGCGHDSPEEESHSLSEVMAGERNVVSPYDIKFREDMPKYVLCRRHLTADEIVEMRGMVQNSVMFDMRIGDMPVSRPVGFIFNDKDAPGGVRQYILSHFDFVLGYAADGRVTSANVSSKVFGSWLHEITPGPETDSGVTVEYSYEVHWVFNDLDAQEALQQQLHKEMRFHTHKNLDIHWLSIINAFVLMLLILSLLLLIIVRVVRSDLTKYLDISEEDLSAEEEQGWKLLHADVFRSPQHRMWLCAGVGTGLHLAAAAGLSIIGGMLGFYYTHNAMSFKASGIMCYTLTSVLGGYWSAWLYNQFGGEKWAWNIFVTVCTFSLPAFGTWAVCNTIAIAHNSTAAFPFFIILHPDAWNSRSWQRRSWLRSLLRSVGTRENESTPYARERTNPRYAHARERIYGRPDNCH